MRDVREPRKDGTSRMKGLWGDRKKSHGQRRSGWSHCLSWPSPGELGDSLNRPRVLEADAGGCSAVQSLMAVPPFSQPLLPSTRWRHLVIQRSRYDGTQPHSHVMDPVPRQLFGALEFLCSTGSFVARLFGRLFVCLLFFGVFCFPPFAARSVSIQFFGACTWRA